MEQKQTLFSKLKAGLAKTRVTSRLGALFSRPLNDDFYEELEEALIMADVGIAASDSIIEELKAALEKGDSQDKAREALCSILAGRMRAESAFLADDQPAAIMIVGVNGVGKTTAIGKLAHYYRQRGRGVLLAAADTFRAAAAEQLSVWAQRAGVPIVKHGEGADPAAVVFDATQSAKAKNIGLLICDTAGRLHNKRNLMMELEKMGRVLSREFPSAVKETLLVLDATTGQNGIAQARAFAESVPLSGIILTKLDGTAKGGIIVAIKSELGLPVRFVGVGEGLEDLQEFDPEAFCKALLERD